MTIHFQRIKPGIRDGIRAAYLSIPNGEQERVIRAALKMERVQIVDPLDINLFSAYIIKGPQSTTYFNPNTVLKHTSYAVKVPLCGNKVAVGICSKIPFPQDELEGIIAAIIEKELVTKGLAPIESKREEIPEYFLKSD